MTEVASLTDTLTASQYLPPVPLPHPARLVRRRKAKVLSSVMNKNYPYTPRIIIIPQQFLPQTEVSRERRKSKEDERK